MLQIFYPLVWLGGQIEKRCTRLQLTILFLFSTLCFLVLGFSIEPHSEVTSTWWVIWSVLTFIHLLLSIALNLKGD